MSLEIPKYLSQSVKQWDFTRGIKMTGPNNQKFKSLSQTKEPVDMSVSEIVDMLKDEIGKQSSILDAGTVAAMTEADEAVLDMIIAEYDSQLLWNLTNTELGKGILIGFLISSVTSYYDELRKAEEADEDFDMGYDMSGNGSSLS